MKAVQFSDYGDPEVLRIVEADPPHAEPGEIRIAVRAAGINGIDWKLRSGMMRDQWQLDLPAGTGMDAAGVIDAVGEGVEGVAVGDAVFGSGNATLAEYATLYAWAKKPEKLSFEEAAGYPIPTETARRILDEVGIAPGETLLISGAAGGVGSATVQLARQRGIVVIGTASARNHDHLRSLGAIPTTYGDGLAERVRDLAPQGVAAALDIAGSGVIPDLIAIVGDPTKVLSIADFSAPEHGAKVSSESVDPAGAYREAARLFEAGAFQLPVAKQFSLAEAAEAHAAAQAGHIAGRIVVTIAQ